MNKNKFKNMFLLNIALLFSSCGTIMERTDNYNKHSSPYFISSKATCDLILPTGNGTTGWGAAYGGLGLMIWAGGLPFNILSLPVDFAVDIVALPYDYAQKQKFNNNANFWVNITLNKSYGLSPDEYKRTIDTHVKKKQARTSVFSNCSPNSLSTAHLDLLNTYLTYNQRNYLGGMNRFILKSDNCNSELFRKIALSGTSTHSDSEIIVKHKLMTREIIKEIIKTQTIDSRFTNGLFPSKLYDKELHSFLIKHYKGLITEEILINRFTTPELENQLYYRFASREVSIHCISNYYVTDLLKRSTLTKTERVSCIKKIYNGRKHANTKFMMMVCFALIGEHSTSDIIEENFELYNNLLASNKVSANSDAIRHLLVSDKCKKSVKIKFAKWLEDNNYERILLRLNFRGDNYFLPEKTLIRLYKRLLKKSQLGLIPQNKHLTPALEEIMMNAMRNNNFSNVDFITNLNDKSNIDEALKWIANQIIKESGNTRGSRDYSGFHCKGAFWRISQNKFITDELLLIFVEKLNKNINDLLFYDKLTFINYNKWQEFYLTRSEILSHWIKLVRLEGVFPVKYNGVIMDAKYNSKYYSDKSKYELGELIADIYHETIKTKEVKSRVLGKLGCTLPPKYLPKRLNKKERALCK